MSATDVPIQYSVFIITELQDRYDTIVTGHIYLYDNRNYIE